MICNKVDLPQPLGPTMETNRPSGIVSDTSSSATKESTPPVAAKLFDTPRATTTSRAVDATHAVAPVRVRAIFSNDFMAALTTTVKINTSSTAASR